MDAAEGDGNRRQRFSISDLLGPVRVSPAWPRARPAPCCDGVPRGPADVRAAAVVAAVKGRANMQRSGRRRRPSVRR